MEASRSSSCGLLQHQADHHQDLPDRTSGQMEVTSSVSAHLGTCGKGGGRVNGEELRLEQGKVPEWKIPATLDIWPEVGWLSLEHPLRPYSLRLSEKQSQERSGEGLI
jgi:hypothetical protein